MSKSNGTTGTSAVTLVPYPLSGTCTRAFISGSVAESAPERKEAPYQFLVDGLRVWPSLSIEHPGSAETHSLRRQSARQSWQQYGIGRSPERSRCARSGLTGPKKASFHIGPVLDLVTESHGRLWEWRALGEPGSPSEASCGSGPAFFVKHEKRVQTPVSMGLS